MSETENLIPQTIKEGGVEEEGLQEKHIGDVMRTDTTIPTGEHLIIDGSAMKSNIVINSGAKLTVEGSTMKCKITIIEGGELDMKGASLKNDIEHK